MDRREFIVAASATVSTALFTGDKALPQSFGDLAETCMLADSQIIWSAESPEVAIESSTQSADKRALTMGLGMPSLHSVFAKHIPLESIPARALIHLFAFTRYRLYINGAYIGRGPCRYQNQRPEYDTWDIARYLRSGSNVVVALVHRDSPASRIMLHDAGFVARIEVDSRDGLLIFKTDPTWLSMPDRSYLPHSYCYASIGETIDARKTVDWQKLDLANPQWKPSVAVPWSGRVTFYPRDIPLQVETELTWSAIDGSKLEPGFPKSIEAGGRMSLELARISQAYHVLDLEADAGSEVEIEYALPDGVSSGRNTYIARAGTQTYMSGDTFAFSKLEIRIKSGRVRLVGATAYEVRYPFQLAASFVCSDPFFDRLWSIAARSLQVLSEDSYVDCADRERSEWIDDCPPAFDCTRTMMRGPDDMGTARWGDARLLRGLLRRFAATQQADGQPRARSCAELVDIHTIMEDRSCGWVILLAQYVQSTGDVSLVAELWQTLTRLLDWYRKRLTHRGLVLAREWEVWDNPLRYQVCEGTGLNALFYRALSESSKLAAQIGRTREAASLTAEAARRRAAFNLHLWNEAEGAYFGGLSDISQKADSRTTTLTWSALGGQLTWSAVDGRLIPTAQGNLFAIYCGIVPKNRIGSVQKWILTHLSEISAPMSYYYLFQMIYDMDDENLETEALTLIKRNWKEQVDSNWQTTWEGFHGDKMSKFHVYCMHPGYFLTAYVLGARREGAVSAKKILIEPRFSGLQWAKGVCVTEFGPVEIAWRLKERGRVELDCNVPDNTKARLKLRAQSVDQRLELNGKKLDVQPAGGWIEATLPPGPHSIHLF